MKVYVTSKGIRCQKRRYMKKADLTMREATYFKKRGVLDVPREIAEVLTSNGWGSIEGPTVYANTKFGDDEPIPLVTSELVPEETTGAPEKTPISATSELFDAPEGEDTTPPAEPPDDALTGAEADLEETEEEDN